MSRKYNEDFEYDNDEIIQLIKPEKIDKLADQIEEYMGYVDKYLFFEGMTQKQYKKKKKAIKKAVKDLRKRKRLHLYFDSETIDRLAHEDHTFQSEYLRND